MATAKELLRFAEDQFVIWERPMHIDRPKSYGCASERWLTPCVLEQAAYDMPITRSVGIMVNAFRRAWEVTGDELYLAKALSLADSLTVLQDIAGGDYVTCFVKHPRELGYWINNAVEPAKVMPDLARTLSSEFDHSHEQR